MGRSLANAGLLFNRQWAIGNKQNLILYIFSMFPIAYCLLSIAYCPLPIAL